MSTGFTSLSLPSGTFAPSRTPTGGVFDFSLDMPITAPLPIKGIAMAPYLIVEGDIKCPGSTTTPLTILAPLTNAVDGQKWLHSFGSQGIDSADFTSYESCWKNGYGKLSVSYTCQMTSDCDMAIGYAMMHTARGCNVKRFY